MDETALASEMKLSRHACRRGAQRNLSDDEMRYVVRHGERFHRRGMRIYFLRDCDLPDEDQANQERVRLIGTAVIVDCWGQTVVTAWRDRQRGLRQIKRMPRYRIDDVRQMSEFRVGGQTRAGAGCPVLPDIASTAG